MATPLVFRFGQTEIPFRLNKVDRSKLYGYKELEVLDDSGQTCELATIADDGQTIVGRGGVALAMLAPDGRWCERNQLKPVDVDGQTIEPVKSSYGTPVDLATKVTAEEYLSHNIRSIYVLESENPSPELQQELEAGTIYSFPYSFRGGLEADCGFLLMSADKVVFLAVGSPTRIQFLGLQQSAVEADATEEDSADGDSMDFDMI